MGNPGDIEAQIPKSTKDTILLNGIGVEDVDLEEAKKVLKDIFKRDMKEQQVILFPKKEKKIDFGHSQEQYDEGSPENINLSIGSFKKNR